MTPQQPRQGEKHYEGDVGHGVLVPVELRIQHQREEAREEDRLAFAARAPAERAQDQSGEQAPACGNEQAPRGDRVGAVSDEDDEGGPQKETDRQGAKPEGQDGTATWGESGWPYV